MFSRFGTILIVVAGVLLSGGIVFALVSQQSDIVREFVLSQVEPPVPVVEHEVSPVTLLFGGDMMFDRYIRTMMRRESGEFVLAGITPTLASADLVVANLEGPISDNASLSETSTIGARENYVFTFDPSVAPLLKQSHIGVVNLGNNHILNFGEEGVRQTQALLRAAGVGYFGSPLSGESRVLMREINGVNVALVNYNQFVWQGKEKALADIAEAKGKADVVILYTHWGTEYVPATESVKNLAHRFVDAGVDLIIGSHPHVVQETEVYHGKTIYYSLGNLVFDQYFGPETTSGLLLRATYHPETHTFSFEDRPVTLKNTGQTVLSQ